MIAPNKIQQQINNGKYKCPKCGYNNFHHEMFPLIINGIIKEVSCNRCITDYSYKEIMGKNKKK